jgi:hypothetical protein
MLRVVRMAHANVAEPIEHTFIGKDMTRGYEIFDDRLVHGIPSVCALYEFSAAHNSCIGMTVPLASSYPAGLA